MPEHSDYDAIKITAQVFDDTVTAAKRAGAPIRPDAPVSQETFTFALAWIVGLAQSNTTPPRLVPAWAFADSEESRS